MTLDASNHSDLQDAFEDEDPIPCTPQDSLPLNITPDNSIHTFDFGASVQVISLDNVVYKIGDLGHAITVEGATSIDDGDTRYMPHEFLNNVDFIADSFLELTTSISSDLHPSPKS